MYNTRDVYLQKPIVELNIIQNNTRTVLKGIYDFDNVKEKISVQCICILFIHMVLLSYTFTLVVFGIRLYHSDIYIYIYIYMCTRDHIIMKR
jgi:hypothetical protein